MPLHSWKIAFSVCVLSGISSMGHAQQTWTQQCPPTNPPGRYAHSVAYDAARGQVVLFGGYDGTNVLNDTWVWDGTTWTQKFPATSPPPKGSHVMVYDSVRQRIVVFGGTIGSTIGNDTWEWDGSNWTQIFPTTSPSPRLHAGMALDAARGQSVLFGGSPGSPTGLGDTWTFDGTTWTEEFPATSPAPRSAISMAYDPVHQETVMFGGTVDNVTTFFNDTWTWDGTTWTQKFPTSSPTTPRSYYRMAYDAALQRIVFFGGQGPNNNPIYGDTWVWDGTNWSELSPATSPSGRTLPAMAYDEAHSQIVLFGGFTGSVFSNDTWLFGAPTSSNCPVPPTTHPLTVASTNPSSGVGISVSLLDNNNLSDGTTQFARIYNAGVAVTLTAPTTASGNNFSSWTGCESTSGVSCTVTMNADRVVTANYVMPPPPPPPPPPSITSINPIFGIQGQTVPTFIVNGSNFQSTSTLSFSGNASDFTISYGRRTTTQILATLSLSSNATVSIRDVIVTNPDSQSAVLLGGFHVARENLVRGNGLFDSGLNEPSIAVDPIHAQHAVVGYNRTPGLTKECAWSESRDAGANWTSGSLSFPSGFHGYSDPWLRYSPKGELYYACIAATDWNITGLAHLRKIGIFVAKSPTGFASDLGQGVAVVPPQQQVCFGFLICGGEDQGGLTDHPSLGILRNADGTAALVACWVDFFKPTGQTYLRVGFSSDGGATWPTTKTLSANVGPCVVGEGNGQVAITYWDLSDQSLKLLISPDGVTWPSAQNAVKLVPDVSQLALDSNGRPESTTTLVLSEPYALGIPLDACPAGQNCMRTMWQTRNTAKSRIYVADSAKSWVSAPLPKPNPDEVAVLSIPQDPERFLPGAGSCPDLIGAYESSDDSGNFRYKVWSLIGNAAANTLAAQTIFRSGQDMNAGGAIQDPSHPGFGRIGDYTSLDCSQQFGWAVWTDRRNTILSPDLTYKHVNEIWVGVIPLK